MGETLGNLSNAWLAGNPSGVYEVARRNQRPIQGRRGVPMTRRPWLRILAAVCVALLWTATALAAGSSSDYPNNDQTGVTTLINSWWSGGSTGQFSTAGWWQQPNALEAVMNSEVRDNAAQFTYIMGNMYDSNDGSNFLNSYYDDEGWWANAWVRAYDLTGDVRYLNMAKTIFTDITGGWDTTCGGGVWWSKSKTYKNAIPNELFLLLAARLHERTPGDTTYLNWANDEYNWFINSGLINSQNLVNDGLTSSCTNNGGTTWTYNQGVILAGLAEMYRITGNSTYLTTAENIANAAISTLVDSNGILQEPCEPNNSCGGDGPQFKGIFVRYLAFLYDTDHNSNYWNFLSKNAQTIWSNDLNSSNQMGLHWDGPLTTPNAVTQDAALMDIDSIAAPSTQGSPFVRAAADPTFHHSIGAATGSASWECDPVTCTRSDFMTWGPYQALPAGSHTAHFRLMVNQTSSSSTALATIDVRENNTGTTLASETIDWNQFTQAGVYQDFTLNFNATAGDPLEYRVYWDDFSGAPTLTESGVVVDAPHPWIAATLNHSIGRLDGQDNWEANPAQDSTTDFMAWGEYTPELGSGNYTAYFEMKVDNFNLDNNQVATLDVRDNNTGQVIASSNITRGQFPNTLWQMFPVTFTATAGHSYEFRVTWDYFSTAPRLTLRGIYVSPRIDDTQVSLPYNQRGITTSSNPTNGNLDGKGNNLAAETLSESMFANYHTYTLGPFSSGNNVLQGGSNVNVSLPSGSYAQLYLMGIATNGNQTNQTFTVKYTDGTSTTASISLSDWFAATTQTGEQWASALAYRYDSTGGKQYGPIHVNDYVINLNTSKTVKTLVLPNNSNVKILAVTLSNQG